MSLLPVNENAPARRGPGRDLLVVGPTAAGYLLASLVLHHRALTAISTATTGGITSDPHQFAWWLTWLPHALHTGQNPLFTTFMHFPLGVNAMWNTTVPVLAALIAPVTLTAGPVAAYNAGMILGPVASGTALFLALRPYVAEWAPRAVAGLLYAFSPFIIAHGHVGHLNMAWSVLPPVLVWVVHPLFIRPRAPLRTGALLGLALAVQTGLYTQTVALGVIALSVTAVVLAARRPDLIASRVKPVLTAAATCCGVYAVLCAYPLYLLLAGPGRPHGQIRDHALTGTDAANIVFPTTLTMFRPGEEGIADRFVGYIGEQGGYLGVPLIAVLLVGVLMVRDTALRLTAAIGVVLLVLSLGITLIVVGRNTGVPLPWRLLEPVPLVGQAEAMRLQVFVALCVAVMVALLWQRWRVGKARVGGVAALVAAATWLPADAHVVHPVVVPAFFTGPNVAQVDGRVVETVPRVNGQWRGGAEPLLWQALSGMAYRTTGGYFIGSDADNPVLFETLPGPYQFSATNLLRHEPPTTTADEAADRLRARGVQTVLVVDRPGIEEADLLAWTSTVTGTPARRFDDVWLFDLPPRP